MENKAQTLLSKADDLLIFGLYEEAERVFTEALSSGEPNYLTLIKRAIVRSKLNKLDEAISDCEHAIVTDSSHYLGFYHRAQYQLMKGSIASAAIDIDHAVTKLSDSNAVCDKGEESAKITNLKRKIDHELAKAKGKSTQQVQSNQTTQQAPQPAQAQSQIAPAEASKPLNIVKNAAGKLLYSWHQNDNKIFVFIREKLPGKDALKTHFEAKKIEVSFKRSDASEFELNLDLNEEVVPESASVHVHFDEVEIQVDKKIKRLNWSKLESTGPETQTGPLPVAAPQQPSYPTSSKVKRDWNKIDKEIEKEMETNKEYIEGDPAGHLFKQIFANADENTRRAMMKSYQTSGGTVLSTNWEEVAQKDYEGKDRPEPPKGQEYKKI